MIQWRDQLQPDNLGGADGPPGSAQGHDEFAAMINLARAGIADIITAQNEAIKTATS